MKKSSFSFLHCIGFVLASCLPLTGFAKNHSEKTQASQSVQGNWQPLTNPPTFLNGVGAPLLLTDGSVIFQEEFFPLPSTLTSPNNAYGNIWKLTPDINGDYVNGTWAQLPSLPDDYAPCFYASAVLPDGRVIFEGGEVNGLNNFVWQGRGAIYDPVSNTWRLIDPPPFFTNSFGTPPPPAGNPPIGDATSVVLENGTFMLADSLSSQAALLDSKTLTWSPTGADKFDVNNEEGWTLLPNGKVLTVNTNVNVVFNPNFVPNLTGSEIYNPKKGKWKSAGSTIVQLSDFGNFFEMGPSILRPDGKVIQFGATGHNAIYDTKTKLWSVAEDFPIIPGEGQLITADAPAALLPNGNVLVACSPTFVDGPLHIFEFTYKANQFVEQPVPSYGQNIPGYFANMLILPTGQILMTTASQDVEIYTPGNRSFNKKWAPKITRGPKKVRPGKTYKIAGIRFNGMSQGSAYGDDYQSATNYPLVRITSLKTGHVFYCRTHDHSFMGVASNKKVHTFFDVPSYIESGDSKLEVVANGIPSKAVHIHVK